MVKTVGRFGGGDLAGACIKCWRETNLGGTTSGD